MTGRSKRGFGSIRRLPSGNYQARYDGPDLLTHKAPMTFTTKASAESWLASERRFIDTGEWSSPSKRLELQRKKAEADQKNTFGVYAEEFLAERELRPTTRREYRRIVDVLLVPILGPKLLKDITLADIKEWHREAPTKSASQRAAAYRVLRAIFNAAEADELIDRSPARLRGNAGTAPATRDYAPATLEQLETMSNEVPEQLKLLMVLAWTCALRQGELLELRRKDVDAKRGVITVERKVEAKRDPTAEGACPSCGRVIGPPKSDAGIRSVNVPPPFLSLLHAHLRKFAAPGSDGLLFRGTRTDHVSVPYLVIEYHKARKAAGREDLPFHGLRKTALTLAGREHATAAELKRRGGHSTLAAMAIYQLADDERDRQLAERLGESYTKWRDAR